MEDIIVRYFGKYNSEGFYEAFYSSDVWRLDDIPTENCIELTKNQWEQAVSEECVVIDGKHQLYVKTQEKIHEELISYVRSERDKLLSSSDWTVLPDSPLDDVKRSEWVVYRQALRDLPQTVDINNIVFPEKPL